MIRNYFTTAFRNFLRHKAYSSIHVLGLAVGLACSFFIVLWIQDEVSYDRFHEDGDRIFAVMRHSTFGGIKGTTRSMPKPLAETLVDDYPEITNTITGELGNGDAAHPQRQRLSFHGTVCRKGFFRRVHVPTHRRRCFHST